MNGNQILEVESIYRPSSLPEVSELFSQVRNPDIEFALYAGGTELLQAAKLGFVDARHLVDLKGIDKLHGTVLDTDELIIGATSTYHEVCSSAQVRRSAPAFGTVCAQIANPRVRSVGTLGGNLCFGDPHSDLASFVVACGATVEIWRGDGFISRPLDGFWSGPYQAELGPGDVVTTVHLPVGPDVVVEHTRHGVRERPSVTCTCFVRLEGQNTCEARLALAGATIVPSLSVAFDACALDSIEDSVGIDELAHTVATEFQYSEDLDGPAEFKKQLAATTIGRTVERSRRRVCERQS